MTESQTDYMLGIIDQFNTQQHPTDLAVEAAFIKALSPNHIVELGTCQGGWPLAINHLTKIKTTYSLIENFEGGEYAHIRDYSWDAKKKYLAKLIRRHYRFLDFELYVEDDVNLIKREFDVFRYDGFSDYNTFVSFIKKAKNDAVIIIHDINLKNEFLLSCYIIKYMIENNLYPMYLGNYTGIFTKSTERKKDLMKKVNLSEVDRISFRDADSQRLWDKVFPNIELGKGYWVADER